MDLRFRWEPFVWDTASYPVFQKMRAAVKQQAELIAIEPAQGTDVTYAGDDAIERANLQHVSGWMFSSLGIETALGRVLTEADDRVPGAGPYAVLSYSYWKSRFARDPRVIRSSLRIGGTAYQIVRVAELQRW